MRELKIDLKNCYGITELSGVVLNFEDKANSALIYAPNGVMKTSFAKTFQQISKGEEPRDDIYDESSTYEIKLDGVDIDPDMIYVIKSSIDISKESEHMTTLLVDEANKAKYDEIYGTILKGKTGLVSRLNKASKVVQKEIEERMMADFGHTGGFVDLLESIDLGAFSQDLSDIRYGEVFDSDVVAILKNPGIVSDMNEYMKEYNAIFDDYPYFEKGLFNPAKAEKISKALGDEGFFVKDNAIILSGEERPLGKAELDGKILEAQKRIAGNTKLKKIRDAMASKAKCLKFQELLEGMKDPARLISELGNLDELRRKLWKSYLKTDETFGSFMEGYKEAKNDLSKIEDAANLESSKWQTAVGIFNSRFLGLPYKLIVKNEKGALLGKESPRVEFEFKDPYARKMKRIDRNKLNELDVLSQGEKRALYLLNIIFEVKVREDSKKKTLFIIDDIADSFDYKNKYAIIQYLSDLSQIEHFRQIILTHNFDFFRTVQSRLQCFNSSGIKKCYIASRTHKQKINLESVEKLGILNPFKNWKDVMDKDMQKFIASIPLVRELVQHAQDESCADYELLTSILHFRTAGGSIPATEEIKIQDLKSVYVKTFGEGIKFPTETGSVFETICDFANRLSNDGPEAVLRLENKVILSIASRLKIEGHIWKGIKDWSPISKNQTRELLARYESQFGKDDNFALFDEVALMTPENIHLNSFMYEPILDMSDIHLKDLYKRVTGIVG